MTLRRLTRLLNQRNASAGWGDLLEQVYMAIFGIAVFLAMLWLPVQEAVRAHHAPAAFRLDPGWLVLTGVAGAAALAVSAFTRFGPVSLSSAQVRWWLPSLERRTTLFGPVLATRAAIGGVLGGILGCLLGLALGNQLTIAIGWGVVAGVSAVGFLTALQPSRGEGRWSDVIVALVPLGTALVVVIGEPAPYVGILGSATIWTVSALLIAVLAAALAAAWRALPLIHDGDVARLARLGEQVGSSLEQLNVRELARALERPRRRAYRRSRPMWRVRGPRSALLAADALCLARSPRHLIQMLAGLTLIAVGVNLQGYTPLVVVPMVLAGGYFAALATAEGARRAMLTPALDALMPLSAAAVRAARLGIPMIAMALFSTAALALVGARTGDPLLFAILGAAGAPSWAAAVLRAAYRKETQLSGVVIPTPMGAFPADIGQVLGTGIDLAAFALLPTWIAILMSAPFPWLIALQAAISAATVFASLRAATKRPG